MPGHRVGRAARVEQWRQRYWHRATHAHSDMDRLAAAVDHLRLALKHTTPERCKQLVEQHAAELVNTAETVLTTYEEGRTHR